MAIMLEYVKFRIMCALHNIGSHFGMKQYIFHGCDIIFCWYNMPSVFYVEF